MMLSNNDTDLDSRAVNLPGIEKRKKLMPQNTDFILNSSFNKKKFFILVVVLRGCWVL